MPSEITKTIQKLSERCAVSGLIRYVVLFNALVFILHFLSPGYLSVLELDPGLVLRGQVWRLVTWIFIPETMSPFWIFFSLLFLLYVGDGLETAMGAAKLTLFYVSGIILCTAVSFLIGIFGGGASIGRANTFLNLSLLLAFATVYPDFKVLVFFVLPVRMAWLAVFSACIMIFSTLGQPLVVAATLAASFLNYILFFHSELRAQIEILRRGAVRFSGPSERPGSSFQAPGAANQAVETLHRCDACGRTEITHPEIDFRVTSDGREFCREHLPAKS